VPARTAAVMRVAALLAAALGAVADTSYHFTLERLFHSAADEARERESLMQRLERFVAESAPGTAQALRKRLADHDALSRELNRHEIYVYLRSEQDRDDHVAAAADNALSAAMQRSDRALQQTLVTLGESTLRAYQAQEPALAPYRYFIDSTLESARHAMKEQRARATLAQPALASLAESYNSLRHRSAPAAAPGPAHSGAQQSFEAAWQPYLDDEAAFAALLLAIVTLQDGQARLQDFGGAPEEKYFSAGLAVSQVQAVLAALRPADAYRRYLGVVAEAAAKRLQTPVGQLHVWDLAAADAYEPPPTAFPDAVTMVLAAEQPMGAAYAAQFRQLFAPENGRVEWCRSEKCDDSGFSVGYAGTASGLFYGAFRGTPNNVRAVAHEAGHAVHRQFMNENQPLAVYNAGPHFLFESFAIFNEFLLWEHLAAAATSPAGRTFYQRQFLEDALRQVYTSAAEVDLEQSIYAGVPGGTLGNANDLDALTVSVLARYLPALALAPQMRVYWARNRLYFTDPLYDVNYLFAGLLALEYLQRFGADPQGFASRYVALLKNGFTDTPQALLARFLHIELVDSTRLVADATGLIERRTAALASSYGAL
jgi:oligoendopeptidase F